VELLFTLGVPRLGMHASGSYFDENKFASCCPAKT